MTRRRWLLITLGLVVWLVLSSLSFLGIAGLWGNPRIPPWSYGWQWIIYANYFGRSQTEEIYLGISAAAGLVPFLMAWRIAYMWRHRKLRLRPGLDGQPQPVIRGGSDNHGHADWMALKDAAAMFPATPDADLGGVVVGELDRVDLGPAARIPFDPDNRATWGRGGRAALMIDHCKRGSTHSAVIGGSGTYKSTALTTSLLTWRKSLFCLDPARELADLVGAELADRGRKVVRLEIGGIGPNVLDGIDIASPMADTHIRAVVGRIMACAAERNRKAA